MALVHMEVCNSMVMVRILTSSSANASGRRRERSSKSEQSESTVIAMSGSGGELFSTYRQGACGSMVRGAERLEVILLVHLCQHLFVGTNPVQADSLIGVIHDIAFAVKPLRRLWDHKSLLGHGQYVRP